MRATTPIADIHDHVGELRALLDLEPGERIGRPLPSRLARAVRRMLLLIVLGGAGWAWLEHRATVDMLISRAAKEAFMLIDRPPPLATGTAQLPLDKSAVREASPPPPSAVAEPSVEFASAADPTTTGDADDAPPAARAPTEPLPPPVVDPGDALQAKALAAGLHPGLSRVLLEALSKTDFANARTAISKALAAPSDTRSLTFPARRQDGLAQFEVTLVVGARVDCRRYVVRVGKSGWLTTALPMERCGIAGPLPPAKAASAGQ